jgi:hypothetical protein
LGRGFFERSGITPLFHLGISRQDANNAN